MSNHIIATAAERLEPGDAVTIKDGVASKTASEGWAYVTTLMGISRKWHYFDFAPGSTGGGRSLCRNYMLLGRPILETGKDDSPDNCAACRKKLLALRAKAEKKAK